MGVYQKWQEERDEAEKKLEEVFDHLSKCLKDSRDSPEPPSDDFKSRVRDSQVKINQVISQL